MKKYLGIILVTGLFLAQPALAVLMDRSAMANQGQAAMTGIDFNQDYFIRQNPCADGGYRMMGNMQNPCYQNFQQQNRVFISDFGTWWALMMIMTVILVWVVLLLLIGVLWHMLKKHRRS